MSETIGSTRNQSHSIAKLIIETLHGGGRGKLFIGASCATPNCSLVNVCMANFILPPEKSEAEISICHVCPLVKVV